MDVLFFFRRLLLFLFSSMFFEYVQRRACACVKAADAVGPSPCVAANMPPPRARNTASAKDLVKCFRSHFKDLDPAAFRKDVEEVVAQYEGLLADIMDETVRPSECAEGRLGQIL